MAYFNALLLYNLTVSMIHSLFGYDFWNVKWFIKLFSLYNELYLPLMQKLNSGILFIEYYIEESIIRFSFQINNIPRLNFVMRNDIRCARGRIVLFWTLR